MPGESKHLVFPRTCAPEQRNTRSLESRQSRSLGMTLFESFCAETQF
jgi:hypothetical protein